MSIFYNVTPSFSSPIEKSNQLLTDGNKNVWIENSDGSKTVLNGRLPRSLGINTKSASSPANIRFQRYELQAQAKKLLPKERVAGCLYRRISKASGVGVLLNKSTSKANFGNLMRCASLWSCPVCAAKISEKRKNDVKSAIDSHRAAGGSVLLATLTNSHNASHSLSGLRAGQRKAIKFFWSDRASKVIFEDMGKIAHITALEVTHGSNGWHPHYHILFFLKDLYNASLVRYFRNLLAIRWVDCCRKAGLPLPSLEHGLDLQDGTYADAYVGKWGLEHELTKGHVKKGKEGGLTPWDFLRLSADGDELSGKLFQEFAIVFKGSRQLFWSSGLKKLYGIDQDKTDQEIVDETEKESEQVLELSVVEWFAVRSQNKRSELLKAVESDHSLDSANDLIQACIFKEIERISAKPS